MPSITGRLRPYVSTAAMGATAGIGEHPLAFLDYAIALVRRVVLVFIWRAILASPLAPPSAAGPAVLSYVVLAQILAPQLIVDTGVLYSMWDGRIASRLLRPLSPFGDYLSEMVGDWTLRLVTFSVPAAGVALALGVRLGPSTGGRAGWSLVSLVLTVAVGSSVDFLFAVAVVRTPENMWAFRYARDALVPLASGLIVPLGLMPWGIGSVLAWLPFASMASAPLRIYTGQGAPAALIALQALWAVVLWSATRLAWRRASARMVSFGG